MIRCPVLIAIEFGVGVINAGLAVIEPLIAPVADSLWDRFTHAVIPEVNTNE